MKALTDYISKSTLKREFAVGLVLWWAGLGTYLMVRLPVTQYAPDAGLVAWGALTIPVLTIAAAAFGADFVAKQTTIAGPPQNTEITTKLEQTEDTTTLTQTNEPKP